MRAIDVACRKMLNKFGRTVAPFDPWWSAVFVPYQRGHSSAVEPSCSTPRSLNDPPLKDHTPLDRGGCLTSSQCSSCADGDQQQFNASLRQPQNERKRRCSQRRRGPLHIRRLQQISTYGDITGKVCGCCTSLTFVRFYLVLYLADFSGDIMFCDRDLGHAEAFYCTIDESSAVATSSVRETFGA